jgi:hypothetical protein
VGVGVQHACFALEDLRQRPVGDAFAVGEAPPPDHQGRRVTRLGPGHELRGQPALPHPGFAVDGHQVGTLLLGHPLVQGSQQLQLPVPTHQGRPESRHTSFTLGSLPQQPVRAHRPPLALQLQRAHLHERESPRRSNGPLPDQHVAGLGRLFQPGRHVDRVAGNHPLAGPRLGYGQDLAGVDPDAHLQGQTVTICEVRVQNGQSFAHPQGRPQGPGGVILVGGRHPEHRHHRIADELLDRPLLRLDLPAHGREVGAHDLLEVLGVQVLAQRGRPGDVGEQHGHELALLGLRRRGDRLSACLAEPGTGGQRRAAVRAHGLKGRAARGAELRLRGVLGPARRARHGGQCTERAGLAGRMRRTEEAP